MTVNWAHEFPGTYWIDEQEERAVLEVLRKRALFRYYGPQPPTAVQAFEAAAREFYGRKYALAVNSGSGALLTAMQALGIGPGDEVIIPAFMWVSTVAAVVQVNAIPVLCEVDDSFCMDPEDLKKKITPRTRLIVPVHMAGCPCDMESLLGVAEKHDIAILEDCAQANGATYRGRKVGSFGEFGMFSLQLNKNMTAGEGGLLLTDDESLYYKAFSGHDMSLLWNGDQPFDPPDNVLTWANGRRMSELCGAVASVQITKLPQIVEHMRGSKNRIKSRLEGTPGLAFRRLNDAQGDSGPFLIVLLEDAPSAVHAAAKMKELGLHNVFRVAEYGLHIYYNIKTLVRKTPLSAAGNPWSLAENAQSVYDYGKGACPQSDALFERSVLIPIPSRLSEEQEEYAADVIREAVTATSPQEVDR